MSGERTHPTFAELHHHDVNVELEIDLKLEDIPEHTQCFVCQIGHTNSLLINKYFPYTLHGQPQLARVQIPGYKCLECHTTVGTLNGNAQAIDAVLQIVNQTDDELTKSKLEAQLAAAKQSISQAL